MKNIIILFSILGITMSANAQDSTRFQHIEKKNLIGINIAPAVSVLTGARIVSPFCSIQYKRIAENWNWRINANYYYNYSWFFSPFYEQVISFKDSTTLEVEKSDYTVHQTDLRLGWEKKFGKKNVRWLLGADMVFGAVISKRITTTGFRTYELDTMGNVIGSQYLPTWESGTYEDVTKSYGIMGIAGVFGMEVPISPRFSLGAQFNPLFLYEFGINTNTFFRDYNDEQNSYDSNIVNQTSVIHFDMNSCSVFLNFHF